MDWPPYNVRSAPWLIGSYEGIDKSDVSHNSNNDT